MAQPTNQSVSQQPISQSVSQLISQSVSQPTNQSVSQPTNQSVSQHQPIGNSPCEAFLVLFLHPHCSHRLLAAAQFLSTRAPFSTARFLLRLHSAAGRYWRDLTSLLNSSSTLCAPRHLCTPRSTQQFKSIPPSKVLCVIKRLSHRSDTAAASVLLIQSY